MTATTAKPKHTSRERRIIERPRLIKMLDECDARVILLLAPAGYGKTTLARQWAKTLNSVIWLSLTPAHRDVPTSGDAQLLAEDVAVRLRRPRGDAELVPDLVVRQPLCNQLHHLPLPIRDRGGIS